MSPVRLEGKRDGREVGRGNKVRGEERGDLHRIMGENRNSKGRWRVHIRGGLGGGEFKAGQMPRNMSAIPVDPWLDISLGDVPNPAAIVASLLLRDIDSGDPYALLFPPRRIKLPW